MVCSENPRTAIHSFIVRDDARARHWHSTDRTHVCDEERMVLLTPSKDDLGVVSEGMSHPDDAGGGVSPTAAAAKAADASNPFATNIEPPSY